MAEATFTPNSNQDILDQLGPVHMRPGNGLVDAIDSLLEINKPIDPKHTGPPRKYTKTTVVVHGSETKYCAYSEPILAFDLRDNMMFVLNPLHLEKEMQSIVEYGIRAGLRVYKSWYNPPRRVTDIRQLYAVP
jgi:hypothetical protein